MALRLARFTQLSGQGGPIETSKLSILHALHLFNVERKFDDALQLLYRLQIDPAQVLVNLCPTTLISNSGHENDRVELPFAQAVSSRIDG